MHDDGEREWHRLSNELNRCHHVELYEAGCLASA
jgi:hypothetical protein